VQLIIHAGCEVRHYLLRATLQPVASGLYRTDGGRCNHILSRKDNDLTASYPSVAAAALQLRPARLLIDGEIVAIDATGRPSFQARQHRSRHRAQIVYYAFDLLYLDDSDLTQRPLEVRRAQLARVSR
jgi:bifunctional non-homologous end joining protein LigD